MLENMTDKVNFMIYHSHNKSLNRYRAFKKAEGITMKKNEHGGLMIEALVSLAIFAVGIVGLLGSFTVSTQLSGENRYRTEVVAIANDLFGQMAVSNTKDLEKDFSTTSSNFKSWLTARVQTLPNGEATINFLDTAMDNSTFVQLTISWRTSNGKTDASRSEYTTTTYFRQTS